MLEEGEGERVRGRGYKVQDVAFDQWFEPDKTILLVPHQKAICG